MPDAAPPPLTPGQRRELEEGKRRARGVTRAVRLAGFNVWTLGALAALTLLLGVGSLPAFLLGLGMGAVAWNEHRGRERLRRMDPSGARLLAAGQLGLMVLVVAYALWSLARARAHPDPALAQVDEILGGDTQGLVRELTTVLYLAVIGVTVIAQGLLARFYLARGAMVERYLRETPDWAVELLRVTGSA